MTAVVKLKYGDAERSTRLVNDQLHIPTIKDMFGLSSVDVDGVAEPADDRGFTFATYLSGSTLHISGSPAQAAVLSGTVHTAFHKNSSLCWHLMQHSKWQWLLTRVSLPLTPLCLIRSTPVALQGTLT